MSTESNTDQPLSSRKVRCLVVQLARLGDTVQSLMALRAAKQLYPQLELHMVVRDTFADAAKRIPWLDGVITLPTPELLGPVLDGKMSERQAMSAMARWMQPVVSHGWDLAINWTYSDASSWLTGLIPARVKLGFSRRKDGTITAVDGWSHFIQAVVQQRIPQNIHLTDVLTTQLLTALQIHVGDPSAEAGDSTVTSKGFFQLDLDSQETRPLQDATRKWIGLQLGASRDEKTWPVESWARLTALILERHPECGIVLLGLKGQDELRARALLERLRDAGVESRSLVNLCGATDFDLWASVIGRCQWVISADTAALHVASVLGTRVLNIAVGGERWMENGPYGNGHYVVCSALPCPRCEGEGESESSHSCRREITGEAVYSVWSYASSEWAHRRQLPIEGHFSSQGFASELGSVRAYRSRIRGTQDGGGVVFEPSIQRALRLEDWSAQVFGHMARAWYCGWVPGVGKELVRQTISPSLVKALRPLEESCTVLIQILEEARKASGQLYLKSSRLRSTKLMSMKDRSEIHDLGRKLMDLDALLARLGKAQPAAQVFENLRQVLMHNLKGQEMSDLGKQGAEAYSMLAQGGRILQEWIRHTLELARPMMIENPGAKQGVGQVVRLDRPEL